MACSNIAKLTSSSMTAVKEIKYDVVREYVGMIVTVGALAAASEQKYDI